MAHHHTVVWETFIVNGGRPIPFKVEWVQSGAREFGKPPKKNWLVADIGRFTFEQMFFDELTGEGALRFAAAMLKRAREYIRKHPRKRYRYNDERI